MSCEDKGARTSGKKRIDCSPNLAEGKLGGGAEEEVVFVILAVNTVTVIVRLFDNEVSVGGGVKMGYALFEYRCGWLEGQPDLGEDGMITFKPLRID